MKQYSLLLVLLSLYIHSYAQTTAPGFYITNANDSINTQIKIPKSLFASADFSKLFFKVEIADSIQGSKKMKPEDIKGFEFVYENKSYRFFSKPAMTKNNLRFLQPVILGPNTNLYYYQTVNQNGAVMGTFYTLEKADSSYLFLVSTMRTNKIKEELKAFYKDNADIQELIESRFNSRASLQYDLREMLDFVNKL